MAFQKKTPLQKWETKVSNLLATDNRFKKVGNKVKFETAILFTYDKKSIRYGKKRCALTKAQPIDTSEYTVTIPLISANLSLIGFNIANPPTPTRYILPFMKQCFGKTFTAMVIGAKENKVSGSTIYLTDELYKIIVNINKEESKDKNLRFSNRLIPFINTSYGLALTTKDANRDYDLLLKELIASGNINQEDIIALSNKLPGGSSADIVIKQQVHKQVEWLIDNLQDIVDTDPMNKTIAKQLGNDRFGFLKTDITGPEHLMEMILTKYGQYTIFGAPVLLNTDKYVINTKGLSRSQFDILLITHLSDLEVVELKRPDAIILSFDEQRNKFYASKELSIAVSQSERYISAVYRDNDEDYKIDALKIRDYIHREIGGVMTIEITRPTALIVIGRDQSVAPSYDELSVTAKKKIKKVDYEKNAIQAYKELKGAHKNITITSYSELIESARTRMIINEEGSTTEFEDTKKNK